MQHSYRWWYLLAALLVLAPAGVRVLTWGRVRTPAVDATVAHAGEVLFKHDWKPNDPLSPQGDGLGPVFNATSCVACHNQAGLGGAGGLEHNVTVFTVRPRDPKQKPREGVVHARGIGGMRESLKQAHPELPDITQPTLDQLVVLPGANNHCLSFPPEVHVSQRNTPALF